MTTVCCVSNCPLPYHTPILNSLAERVSLHVLYMSKGHPMNSFQDLWGAEPAFEHSFHWSKAIASQRSDLRLQLSAGVSRPLSRLDPDVILFSSWGPLVWEPLAWKRIKRRSAVMWTESTRTSGIARSRLSNGVRRAIIKSTDAFVANGSGAADFIRELGAPRERVVTSCLPSTLVPAGAPRDRSREHEVSFVMVSRLVPRKRPLSAVRAFRALAEERDDIALTIVGDGPLESEVIAACNGSVRIKLRGRLEGEALAAVLRDADVLVVPSVREVWGLVVNEGLAHGAFVVATDQVGAAIDLVDGASGLCVRSDDEDALLHGLRAAANAPRDSAARSLRAARVSDCTPERFARDIAAAIQKACS